MSATQCAFCDYLNPVGAKSCKKCNAPFHLAPCPFCTAVNDIAATSCYKCHAGLEPHQVRIFDSLEDDDLDQKTLPDIVAHTRTSTSIGARAARVEPAMQSTPPPETKREPPAVMEVPAAEQPIAAGISMPARSEPQLKTHRGPAIGVAVAALAVVGGIAFFALRGPATKEAATAASVPAAARPIVTAPSNAPAVAAPNTAAARTSAPPASAVVPPIATPTTSSATVTAPAAKATPVPAPLAQSTPPQSTLPQSTLPPAPPIATAAVTKAAPAKVASKSHTQRRATERAAAPRAAQPAAPVVAPLRLPPPPPCTEAVAALGLCPK